MDRKTNLENPKVEQASLHLQKKNELILCITTGKVNEKKDCDCVSFTNDADA